jgi:DMSO/TMAO reductase YedYZ molybdopterin-dependent catalytic subunit
MKVNAVSSSTLQEDLMVTRRTVLRQAGFAGVGLALADVSAFGFPAIWMQSEEEVVPFTDVPADFTTKNAQTGRVSGLDLRQLSTFITPEENYFVVAHYGVPKIDAAIYTLEIKGRVASPRSYTLDELKKRARAERTCVFECGGNRPTGIQNRMIGNSRWTGTSLKSLIDDAKPLGDAREVICWGADQGVETIRNEKYEQNFARSITLDDLATSGAILAWEQNGQPLTADHGFPVRVVIPGWYGVQNVKWLNGLEVSNERFMGRFQARDYVTIMGRKSGDKTEWVETSVTKIRTKSMIARVTRRRNGSLSVFGVALTDGTPLRTVEVQFNEGPWVAAKLDAPPNPYTWTWFRAELPAAQPGAHTVSSRATDALGRTQPESLEMKKTNWENNAVWRRQIQVA